MNSNLNLRIDPLDENNNAGLASENNHSPWHKGGSEPLAQWIESEAVDQSVSPHYHQDQALQQNKRTSLLRRATVAYGIVELTRHVMKNDSLASSSTPEDLCSMTNFAVQVQRFSSDDGSANGDVGKNNDDIIVDPGWEVLGVEMVSPNLSLRIIAPSFSGDFFDEDSHINWGKNVGVEIFNDDASRRCSSGFPCGQCDELKFCHLLGNLLYGIFSSTQLERNSPANINPERETTSNSSSINQPAIKRRFLNMNIATSDNEVQIAGKTLPKSSSDGKLQESVTANIIPLTNLGCSSSVWALVKNLIDCGLGDFRPDEAYPSLLSASQDVHRLLLDPERFLFDHNMQQPKNGKLAPKFPKDRLYGREKETSTITDAFCRVASSGECEALFIGGWSGSGKSRLAATAFVPVTVAGGYVVSKKFDEISKQNQLPVVLSAFNELCILIKDQSSEEELRAIEAELINIFGTNLRTLARIMPSVIDLFPTQSALLHFNQQVENEINFTGLSFTIQCFMRVISNKSRPVMIFMDDLQWSDELSIGLVRAALTDIRQSSCLFFVGSYRNNEVQPDHVIFKLMDDLESFNVRTTKLNLDGMSEQHLNTMISDTFFVFPRLCRTLSSAVFHKTLGNPFFALEFLESLVQRDHIQYSYRERRWVWNENKIREEEITDSVLHLLTTKMSALPTSRQESLKIASCFGIQIQTHVVHLLRESEKYLELESDLDDAVQDGFLERDKSRYQFVHDKVREAAASLIAAKERDQYHYDIGMSLLSNTPPSDVDSILLLAVDQINCSMMMIMEHPVHRVSVAELNMKAGAKTMKCSNFMSAYSYMKVGVLLLPDDMWENYLALSVDLHLLLARAAYALGHIDEASETLKMLIEKIEKLENKLDVYIMYIMTLHAKKDIRNAFVTCQWVLTQLGEHIPVNVSEEEATSICKKTQAIYESLSDAELCNMKENKNKSQIAISKFYDLMVIAAFHAMPRPTQHYYVCKWAQTDLTNGFCKHTPNGLAYLACTFVNWNQDTREGYRIGKIAMGMLKRFDVVAEIAPYVYLSFYSYVAILVEPFQSCADMLLRGHDLSMASGNIPLAAFNIVQMVPKAMFGGIKLPILKKEIQCQLKLALHRSQKIVLPYWLILQDTVLVLLGEDALSPNLEAELLSGQNESVFDHAESLCHLRLLSSYWLGRYERGKYYAERSTGLKAMNEGGKFRSLTSHFYYGLTLVGLLRRKHQAILMKKVKSSIAELKDAADISKWNFQNKKLLLEAEFSSVLGKFKDANALYDSAISAAKDSKFTHEQGLACELAAFHYFKIGDRVKALSFFEQAKECYHEWGSQMKVKFVDDQIQFIHGK